MTVLGFAKRQKYGNVRTVVDCISFASKREATRWQELLLMQRAGAIRDLERQVRFPLKVKDEPICTYVADFQYLERVAPAKYRRVVEDSKGFATPEFKIKAALMKACLGIEVLCT